ncbi:endo-1,4-beta-xylanase [Actinoplanes campanulatus]|uniref:Beta-xylanase n=1 Tax=Actinoplanes campanulatus TaxID=113559 RepID=A0A7W5FES9_9ACTN|nr:endo-1,4-beta-xylanase [Actinoplanes campanulatus]MBB3095741.1 endo-1,4-beta-xylanase [Actinoplanes campanulatus]GGN11185.1 beta-xylanase [Actinoplanes campanulatus]GID36638.1 beta-xylanase [Actinoplanes campanulatus]
MRRPWLPLAVATATALLGGQLAFAGSATAGSDPVAAKPSPAPAYPADSLRALAARVGLRIGTAVNADELGSNEKYTQITAEQFSSVTAENAMKWAEVEAVRGTYTWEKADQLVAFAEKNRQLVRGHTLLWHNQLPAWLSTDGYTTTLSNEEVKAVLKEHIFAQVRHFKGDIWQWDVVNEAFDDNGQPRQTIWYKAWGGTGYIADAFRWAHQADPKALLFYNDYNLEFTGPKSNAVYELVKSLKAQRVPIHGVGFQGHLSTQYGYPDLLSNLERFAALGQKVALTEVDVRTLTKPDAVNVPVDALAPYAQESYWSRSLKACLAVRACISFTPWGFGDSYSWVPGWFDDPQAGAALIYDEQLNPKGQYHVLQQDLALAAGAPHRG